MKNYQYKSPTLRFAPFEDGWEMKKLAEVAEVKTGPFGSVLHQHDYVAVGTPIITVEHLSDLGIVHENLPLVSNEDKTRLKSYHLQTGDLVFSRVGSVDRCSIISEKENGWLFSGRLLRVRIRKHFPTFFNYIFQLEATKQKVRSIAVGQTMPSINTEILKSIELQFPALPEQQKIGAFFTAIDNRLAQLKKKQKLLEVYKKAVMQQIFAQQLRFKKADGSDFDDWEMKSLNKVGTFKNGINKSSEDFGFGFPFINLMDVFGKPTIINSKFDLVNANEKELKIYELKKGDVLFIRSSVKKTGIGEISVVLEDLDNTVYSGFLIRFRDEYIKLDLQFKKYCFSNKVFRENIIALSTTSANTNINQEALNKLEIVTPCLEEQKKIGDFLSAIDAQLIAVRAQLAQTETWKKGLLQRMFV